MGRIVAPTSGPTWVRRHGTTVQLNGHGEGRSVQTHNFSVNRSTQVPPALSGHARTQGTDATVAQDDRHDLVRGGRPRPIALTVAPPIRCGLHQEPGPGAGPGART